MSGSSSSAALITVVTVAEKGEPLARCGAGAGRGRGSGEEPGRGREGLSPRLGKGKMTGI